MWNLIQKYIAGQCTDEELRRIEEWMRRSPANRRLVNELQQIWELAPEEDFEVNADVALERFKQKMNQKRKSDFESSAVSPTPLRIDKGRLDLAEKDINRLEAEQSVWKNFLRVAAAILIAVSIGWYAGTHFAGQKNSATHPKIAMQQVTTQRGKNAEISFSDGSRIILNSASTLRFPKEFKGHERKVYLDGEAYFEVAHNTKNPFVVQTSEAEIRDLGTKFDVRAWSEDKKVAVTVREGEVAVNSNQASTGQEKVILKKGQYTVVESGKASLGVETVDYRNYMLWLKGGLYFDDAPFSEVIRQVERRFDVTFDVKDNDLLRVPYTGKFIKANLSKVLAVLSVSMDITFQKQHGTIIIRKRSHKRN